MGFLQYFENFHFIDRGLNCWNFQRNELENNFYTSKFTRKRLWIILELSSKILEKFLIEKLPKNPQKIVTK